MYTKDKSTRITLRLNDDQFAYVKSNADILGVSPSEFLRMVINSTMVISQKAGDQMRQKLKEGSGRENDKADQHDCV